jgi:hypothetical protein
MPADQMSWSSDWYSYFLLKDVPDLGLSSQTNYPDRVIHNLHKWQTKNLFCEIVVLTAVTKKAMDGLLGCYTAWSGRAVPTVHLQVRSWRHQVPPERFSFFLSGVRLSPFGTAATTVPTPDDR